MCTLFLVRGRVQGVCFRASAQRQAERLGIGGWVRNLNSGDVEALACGGAIEIEAFSAWLEQGPEQARVESVGREPHGCESPQTFEIR